MFCQGGGRLGSLFFLPEARLNKFVQVAVQDVVNLGGFVVGAVVLDHLVRLHYVRADLVPPGVLSVFAADRGDVFKVVLFLQ